MEGFVTPEWLVYLSDLSLFLPLSYALIYLVFRLSWHEAPVSYPDLLIRPMVYAALSRALDHRGVDPGQESMVRGACVVGSVVLCRQLYVTCVLGPKPRIGKGVDLTGRTYVVTGGNTGIGFETCRGLLRRGATVIVMCRSLERGQKALDQMGGGGRANLVLCDLCSLKSVREAADSVKGPVHVLILNAGVMMGEKKETEDGIETTMAANHLGHFLLTNLLLEKMSNQDPRVVILSSSTHFMAKRMHHDDLNCNARPYSLFGAYSQSKLANLLFAKELSRRLPELKVYCVHPGLVQTEVARNMHPVIVKLYRVFGFVMSTVMKSPVVGSWTTIHCAVSENKSVTDCGKGTYWADCVMCGNSRPANDERAAKDLWEESEKVVGLKK